MIENLMKEQIRIIIELYNKKLQFTACPKIYIDKTKRNCEL